MFVLLLILSIVLIIYGVVEVEDWASTLGSILAFIFLVAVGFSLVQLINISRTIPKQIEVYEEENARIEEQISAMVTQYMDYEGEVISKVAENESAITLVALYPDLKSDKLVQTQIDVYVSNNNKIKELKDKQTKKGAYRFWLYFGW